MPTPGPDHATHAQPGVVEGCPLDLYVRVCQRLVRVSPRTAAERAMELARHGFDAASWERVDRGWTARIRSDDSTRTAFQAAYAAHPTWPPAADRAIATHDDDTADGEDRGADAGPPAATAT